jgi:hypothetical protein
MENWLENNNRYLEASLQWLRLRLQRLVPEERLQATPTTSTVPATHVSRLSKWFTGHALPEVKLLPAGEPPSLDAIIADAAEKREAAANMDPPPALLMLANLFGLSPFERDTLFLCAALEFDPSLASHCGAAQANPSRNYPTFSLAFSLFDNPRWDTLSTHGPLRYARLIEINQPGAVPLTAAALRADERIVNFLKGLNVLDDRLASSLDSLDSDGRISLAGSQRVVVDEILDHLKHLSPDSRLPVIQLRGVDTASKLAISRLACESMERKLCRIAVEALPAQLGEIETLARLWQRESFLLPLALYIEIDNVDGNGHDAPIALQRLLSRDVGLVFLSVRENSLPLNVPTFIVDVEKPTAAEQFHLWTTLMKECGPEPEIQNAAQVLAGQFDFNVADICQAASFGTGRSSEDSDGPNRIWEACRNLTRPRLDSLAQRLEPKATWDDLVLPDDQMQVMREIAGQVRNRHKVYDSWGFSRSMNRGFGISALFSGESGTGKTMAAEVLANDLQLNLYRIDLSAVVSKFIGETEKNLRKLFDAAERGGAILFFDEADALFGKRSEVKDSHDRYANIEVNYLLQRMEAFKGLAILATNMKSALDPAFMRRLRFILKLPFPGLRERKLIWQKALPPQTPRADLDFDRLARLNLAGGNIHSIALNAAFNAAENGQMVTMAGLLAAARGELKKLEKPFSESEFRFMEKAVGQP